MTARAELPTGWLQAGLLAGAVLIGLLAGANPKLALVAAFGIGFVGVTVLSLSAGLCIFAVLTFVDSVLPYDTAGLSFPKMMGLLLVVSWLGRLTTNQDPGRRIFENPGFLFVLMLFVGWVLLSSTWAEEPALAFDAVTRYVPNALLFLITYAAVRDRKQALWLIGALVIGTLLSAAYGFAVPTDPKAADRLSGAGGNANETAAALAAGVALAASLAVALKAPLLRLAAAVVVPLCIIAIALTLSRGGLVALGAVLVAGVVMAGNRRGVALATASMFVVLCVGYFAFAAPPESRDRVTNLEGGTGRTDIWKVGWRMVEANPLHGVGAENFATSSIHYLLAPGAIKRSDFIVDTPKVAHNTYLGVLAELGIVGLVLFLAIVGYSMRCALKAIKGFVRLGDRQLEIITRGLFVALIGLLAAAFFGSKEFSKQLWLLMSICPALLALARAGLEQAALDDARVGQR